MTKSPMTINHPLKWQPFFDTFHHLAQQFRCGLHIEAALELSEIIKKLVPQLSDLPSKQRHAVAQILSQLLLSQEREDWICLADWLEYDLVYWLSSPSDAYSAVT
ncbi:MAG: hypothetical protein ACRDCQ_01655 [Aeromonas sobria]